MKPKALITSISRKDGYIIGNWITYIIKYFEENAFEILGLSFKKFLKIKKNF